MRIAAILIGLLALTVAARGQVVQLNTGQQLDANNQVGSGGYNKVVGGQGGVNSQLNTQLNGNLYITGQTSGLSPFGGRVPYFASNQLNLVLPSNEFDTFRGQSVGLGNIMRGQTHQTTPYYNQNQTAFGVQGIVQGRTAPGTNAPINSIAQPVAPYVYADVIKAYEPIATDIGVPPMILPPTIGIDSLTLGKYLSTDVSNYGPTAPIFSGLTGPQRQQLARELYDLAQREEPSLSQVNANVNAQLNAQAGAPAPLPPLSAGSQEPAPGTRSPTPGQPVRPGAAAPEPGAAASPNQDVFSDVLMNLYKERRGAPNQNLAGQTPSPTSRPAANNALVELKGNEVYMHSLAGAGKDSFNLFMLSAQRKMQDGKFYAASRDYESALTLNPSNPLALEGAGLAKFAAGEPFSAAFDLGRAIELFPPLMETRLDITKLVDEKTFSSRLAALDLRLAAGPDREEPLLLMLAAFLHQNAGQTDQAKTYAKLLNDAPRATKLMQAYAQYVLTGKKPAQPAVLKAQPPIPLTPPKAR